MNKNYKWMIVAVILLTAGKASAAEFESNKNDSVPNNESNYIVYADVPSGVEEISEGVEEETKETIENQEDVVQESQSEETLVFADVPSPVVEEEMAKETKAEKETTEKVVAKKTEVEIKEMVSKVANEASEAYEDIEEVEEFQENEEKQESQEDAIQPMTIYMGGIGIPYQNGGQTYGQSIIDADNNVASTWGGQPVQNGNDGLSTHFIAHNPGIFSVLFNLSVGNAVQITDESGHSSMYSVVKIWRVDDYGIDLATGEDTWELITGSNNGETVVFQTCIDNDTNLIVMAQ